MKHVLMIKRCMSTGLFYLCKTTASDPYKYAGSGTWWRRHVMAHKSWIVTCVIGEYDTHEELNKQGLFYSQHYDVVKSSKWANLTEERGSGGLIGNGQMGKTWKIRDTSKMSVAKKALYATVAGRNKLHILHTQNKGRGNHQFKGIIVTPWGEFDTIRDCINAARLMRRANPAAAVITDTHTLKKYVFNLDTPLDPTGRRTIIDWRGKTPRTIGFNFIEKDKQDGEI